MAAQVDQLLKDADLYSATQCSESEIRITSEQRAGRISDSKAALVRKRPVATRRA
jgi:hypothetical protein